MKFVNLSLIGLTAAINIHGDGALNSPMVEGSKVTKDGDRWIPERYSTDSDDQLMRTLIETGIAYTKDNGKHKTNYQFTTKEGKEDCGATPA